MTIHHAQYLPCGASMTHLASSGRDVHAQHDVVCTKFQMGKSTMSTGEIGTGEIGDQWSVPAYFTSRLQQPTQLSLFPSCPHTTICPKSTDRAPWWPRHPRQRANRARPKGLSAIKGRSTKNQGSKHDLNPSPSSQTPNQEAFQEPRVAALPVTMLALTIILHRWKIQPA